MNSKMLVRTCVLDRSTRHVPNLWLKRTQATATIPIPESPSIPLLGTAPYQLISGGPSSLHTYIDKLHKKLGPIFYDGLAGSSALFISDPVLNLLVYQAEGSYPKHFVPPAWTLYLENAQKKRGIFFMDDEEWKKNRRILTPVMLHRDSTSSFISTYNAITTDLMKIWAEQEITHDLEYQLYSWNIESVSAFTLGKRLGYVEKLKNGGFTKDSKEENFVKAIYSIFLESVALQMFPPNIAMKLNLPMWKRFSDAVTMALDLGNGYVQEAIDDYKKNGPCQKALLNHLMKSDLLDDQTIKFLLTDIILAATDTTSQTAQWILYSLGRNPEVAEKARQEVLREIGSVQNLNEANIQKLVYVGAILKETLRLYPPASFLTRQIMEDIQWDGYTIPKHTWVMTSLITMGRSEKYFTDPLEFKPERWFKGTNGMSNTLMTLQRRASVPWGLGIRNCIGKRQATTLMTIFMAQTLLNFKWESKEEIKPIMRMITAPEKPLVFKMEKITK